MNQDDQGSNGGPAAEERPKPVPVRASDPPTPARPTPVREALDLEAPPAPPEVPTPVRRFQAADGRSWQARLEGRTRSGRPADRGVDLALLTFHPVDDDAAGEGEGLRPRELLLPLSELDELSDDQLVDALDRARVPSDEASGFFADTRRSGR